MRNVLPPPCWPPAVRVMHLAAILSSRSPGVPIRAGLLADLARTSPKTVQAALAPLVAAGYLRRSGRVRQKFWSEVGHE